MKKNYSVTAIESFRHDARKLIKKYRSISNEIIALSEALAENPMMGTSLGDGVYKIRLRIASKQKGKSGGARVITCVKVLRETVFLLSIYDKSYDKSEQTDIADEKIKELMEEIPDLE